MLSAEAQFPHDSTHWRRINMRKVAHLAGAESLHNLYNRHWPSINSIRFRHTLTNYKDGRVESFAPISEWQYLQHWLSKKFISQDTVLIREIEAILSPTYELIDELMAKVDGLDFVKLSNQELALIFIDIMDLPIGEIYRLNVVQIEYSLNYALHSILETYESSPEDRNFLLSKLIAPGELTVAQEEEIEFSKIIRKARRMHALDPYKNEAIRSLFLKHIEVFAPKHCAYGEMPPSEDDYTKKYIDMYEKNRTLLTKMHALINIKNQAEDSERLLARINDSRLSQLCRLMARIGVFRDKNKAKLGETVVRRLRIMDEISARTTETRSNLDLYLIAEIVTLLDTGQALTKNTIKARQTNGVTFERSEDVSSGIVSIKPSGSSNASNVNQIPGICASSGIVEGFVKVIFGKDDQYKMRPGDIMVAIGTDFDLIEIMNISSGIITEEGGLLSHASVVSRELNKPCLIGVEDATVTLKDGDRVRLDAINGHVEILG
jgi:phosphohistidine swiveling domain-containing protein